jgi:sirohydrochlorin ferrochelatase
VLDLDHPRSRHVLEAARLEDLIRKLLLAWREDEAAASPARAQILQTLLRQLEALNATHFGASKKIYRTLDALGHAMQGADAGKAWQAFMALDGQGDNFGTWAI